MLDGLPAPPPQKAFHRNALRTESFKCLEPLRFCEAGELRRPLWKCTEWTLEVAVPALRREGLIR